MKIDVLIVEDDPQIAKLLQTILNRMQFSVRHCADGAAGVEAFKTKAPDVMLVDGLLPKKSGHDVCTEIRAAPGGDKIGIILVSAAFRGAVARRDAYRAGFDAVFAKPFVMGDLIDAILTQAERYTGKTHDAAATIRRGLKKTKTGANRAIRPLRTPTGAQKKIVRPARPKPAAAAPPPSAAPAASPETKPRVAADAAAKPAPSAPVRKQASGPFARIPQGAPDAHALTKDQDALQWMLKSARARLSGVLQFRAGAFEANVAILRGLIVGASDNLRENQLRERLARSGILDLDALAQIDERMGKRKERFLEAAVALAFVTPRTANRALSKQLHDRVRLVCQLDTGTVAFQPQQARAEAMFVESCDLLSMALGIALAAQDAGALDAFLAINGDKVIYPMADMEGGLVRYAKLAPSSILPQQLFIPNVTPRQIVQQVGDLSAGDLVALYRLGLFSTEAQSQGTVPAPIDVEEADALEVDEESAMLVQRELLAARGRDLYALLEVDPKAPLDAVQAALASAQDRFGRKAMRGVRLGDAKAAAQELWSYLEDAQRTFSDAARRAEYDGQRNPDAGRIDLDDARDADSAFLAARVSFAQGNFGSAHEQLVVACAARPNDVEFDAHRLYAAHAARKSKPADTTAALVALHQAFPLALRPLLFLIDVAVESSDVVEARAFLELAKQLNPDDPEVQRRVAVVA